LPAAVLALVVFGILVLKYEWQQIKGRILEDDKPYGEIVYNVVQFAAFTIMAVLIMRLKLFFTPHLCIIAALLASKRVIGDLSFGKIKAIHQQAFCALLIAVMAIEGMQNLQQQWSVKGEYTNDHQEQLFTWIMKNTPKDAVFAGSMPTMANVKLSTERPIVNHPHYEDSRIRAKTEKIYTLLSRKPLREVHRNLKEVKSDFVVLPRAWCQGRMRTGCALVDIWDTLDEKNKYRKQVCESLTDGDTEGLFEIVFANDEYTVLKIL